MSRKAQVQQEQAASLQLPNSVERHVTYFFTFALVILFVLEASPEEHFRIFIALLLGFALSITAFLLKWLTLDGAQSAGILGALTFGLGGINTALLMLVFFITGSMITRKSQVLPQEKEFDFSRVGLYESRRNGKQVWANGFWFAIGIILWFTLDSLVFWTAAIASLSVAMADTWGTEIGSRLDKTVLITSRKKVPSGTDGGVSTRGTIASFLGSALLGLMSAFFYPENALKIFLVITVVGFMGGLVDSLLGAYFQFEGRKFRIPILPFFKELQKPLSNNDVNLLATGFGFIATLILGSFLF